MTPPPARSMLLACIAIPALAFWGALDFYASTQELTSPSSDVYRIGEQEARFGAITAALPRTGTIGYVSDQPLEQTVGSAMYFGAQYALAPRLLSTARLLSTDGSAGQRLVVGNFSRPADWNQFAAERKLKFVRDFGSGVVLFEREGGRQ
jgi:hypothetical protein